mgnify:CR=1 FL=1
MPETILKSKAFQLKGRLYTFTVIQLLSNDSYAFAQQLEETIAQAPLLFDGTPVVIDCQGMHAVAVDFEAICAQLRNKNILPVAVQGVNAAQAAIAQCLGLAVLRSSSAQDKPLSLDADIASKSIKQGPPTSVKARLYAQPVRSGQQIVAKGCDLIITSSVSHGAELLADGNIHVYGVLHGRALAGISGDKNARIFCHSLDAELVAIAGIYCLSDVMQARSTPCQIYLQDERIIIDDLIITK